MCNAAMCQRYHSQWITFRSPWGSHRGVIEGVNNQAVLVRMPAQYAPSGFAHFGQCETGTDEARLGAALMYYGRPGYGPGYGAAYGRYGAPGWGAWRGGWWWWWLAFAWIFALALLW